VQKFALFNTIWDLEIVSELNGQSVKLAKRQEDRLTFHDA